MRTFIALFHLRRKHRHRWRNIWGKYPVLLWVHRDLAVLCLLELRRCRADQPDRVDLCFLLSRDLHRDQGRRFDQLDRVVRFRLEDQHRRGSMASLELGYQRVLSLRLCQDRRGDRWGQPGQVVRCHHLCLGLQGCRSDQVHQVLQVDRPGLVDQVGTVGTVVVGLPSKFPMEGDQVRRVIQERQVCLVFRSFRAVLVDQEDRASSSYRNQPASWRSFGCAQRGQW